MRIGIPKEIKVHEYRVGMTPAGVAELVNEGHQVFVQSQAGAAIGMDDAQYQQAGAQILATANAVYDAADLIVKVKEPQAEELPWLRADQVLFTYLHLAANPALTQGLLTAGVTALAYETVLAADGSLPLLTPMSEVAGRMSIQVAAHALQQAQGGRGVLLGGVAGVPAGQVVILGGGVAGTQAAQMALGLQAEVTIIDQSLKRLRELNALFAGRVRTVFATQAALHQWVQQADVVIGAVLVPGAAAPKLITRDQLRELQPGAVLVDIAIDQGGCFATSRATTHEAPTFVVDGVIHYCVANMPGAVPRTSTLALTNATLPYIRQLARLGVERALRADAGLAAGLNVRGGLITHAGVAASLPTMCNQFDVATRLAS